MLLFYIPSFNIESAEADNSVKKIVKVTGSLVGGVQDEDFLLPESIDNQSKSVIFMSVRHLGDSQASEAYRSWSFVNNSAIRFHGNSDAPANNIAMDFVAYIVEFSQSSDLLVQNGTLIVDGADVDKEFVEPLSPSVNASNAIAIFDGLTMLNHTELSWGAEEFGITRVLNDTHFGYEPFDAPNSGNTEVRFSVIDWKNSDFIIQNGTGTLVDGEGLDTIVPSPAINRTHTMLLVSTQLNDLLDATSDEYAISALINPSNEIEIQRDDSGCSAGDACEINYRWMLVTFPTTFATVIHDELDDTSSTGDDVTESIIDIFSPALTNVNNSIAIGTVQTPFGLGNSRDSSGSGGSWDRQAYTIELINSTAINATINDGRNTNNMGYQVIEFTQVGGETFNQNIIDTVTVTPDDADFTINKTAVDFGTTVDLETNMNITKLGSDLVGSGDTVSANAIFVINLNDTGTALDVLHINVTKLAEESVGVGDDPQFVITKLLDDIVAVNDTVTVATTFGLEVLDTATVDDLIILNITKQFSDVTSQIDDLNIDATKIFIDTTSIVDTTDLSLDRDANQTDTGIVFDNVILNVTKLINNVASTSDTVVLERILPLTVNDTISVDDPSILFTIASVIPNGTTGISGGGGAGLPTFQRLVGLNIISELFFVEPADVVPSDFIIETFGRESSTTSILSIVPEQQFVEWFDFSPFPDPINYQTTVDSSRTINDPARFKNTALDDFVLNIPSLACSDLDPFATPVPCIDPIVYEADLIFTFKKGGVEFKEKHTVTIDATTPIICDEICQLVEFVNVNWWWLAGLLIMFMILYFAGDAIRSKGIRTTRRVNAKHFQSFSADKPSVKFKKGKRK